MVKFDGVGLSTVECVPGFESGDEVKGLDQTPKVVIFFLELFPFTLPHYHHIVAISKETVIFEFGGFVDISHGLIAHFMMCTVTVWITLGTSMPETSVEFVHIARDFVVSIHKEGFVST